MNRKETAERIKIMQAFVDGKLIEFKDCMGRWRVAVNPSWDWDIVTESTASSQYKSIAHSLIQKSVGRRC